EAPAPVESRASLGPADDYGGPDAVHHAVAVDGGHRGADRCLRSRHARRACAQHPQHSARAGGGAGHRGARHHPRPHRAHRRRAAEMSAAIEFRNVDIVFGKEQAEAIRMIDGGAGRAEILEKTGAVLGCAGATLTVEQGEISVLMGLSGSGKSTLLRAVNGLNPVTRGEVVVHDGKGWSAEVVSASTDDLRRIRRECVAMVFQQFALLPWRTVEENVGFGLELAGVPAAERRERVARQLELVGLSQWSGKYA